MTIETGIDLNSCVPGQQVKLRDERIVTYNGLIDDNILYTHQVDDYSYVSNGRFWDDSMRTSTKDVVEILPLEDEDASEEPSVQVDTDLAIEIVGALLKAITSK